MPPLESAIVMSAFALGLGPFAFAIRRPPAARWVSPILIVETLHLAVTVWSTLCGAHG